MMSSSPSPRPTVTALAHHRFTGVRWWLLAVPLLTGAIVAGIGIAIDWKLYPGRRDLLYSDIFAGLAAGVLAFIAGALYHARQRALLARMRVIAEMNHHVRNALSGITLSVHLRQDGELIEVTQRAVQRIDWALREVLPGEANSSEPPQSDSQRKSA